LAKWNAHIIIFGWCEHILMGISSVYSSKIECENIDFDSYFKHKFLNVKFWPDYTGKADDLYAAYDFIDNHELKNYFNKIKNYYSNIKKLGLEYEDLDYSKSLDFLVMTVNGIDR